MAGLLDFIESPEGRLGLLQLGANMMRPTRGGNFGEAFSNGLQGGVQGYTQAVDMGDRRQQRELLNQQRQLQIAQLQKAQAIEAARQKAFGLLGQPKDAAPTIANATNPQMYTPQDIREMLLRSGDVEGIKALQGIQPKYNAPTTLMINGKPTAVQFDEQGNYRPVQGAEPYNEKLDPRNIDFSVSEARALLPFKKEVAAAGAARNNVSFVQEKEEDKVVGKQFGEMYANLQKAGFSASGKISKLDRMSNLLQGVQTGKLTPAGTDIAAAAESVGLKIDPNLGTKQAAQALASELALSLRSTADGGGMPGAMSDNDIKFLTSMTPNLAQTPEGNKLIIETAKKVAKRDQDVARLARDYRKKNGRIDEGFYDALQTYSDAHPLFPQATPQAPTAKAPKDLSDDELLKAIGQ